MFVLILTLNKIINKKEAMEGFEPPMYYDKVAACRLRPLRPHRHILI